jgi:hypothetical protein
MNSCSAPGDMIMMMVSSKYHESLKDVAFAMLFLPVVDDQDDFCVAILDTSGDCSVFVDQKIVLSACN